MKLWLAINSIGLAVIGLALYLTIRQVGLILGRLGPIGARSSPNVGPRVGENLSPFLQPAEAVVSNGKPTLYVFGSDSCGICTRIKSSVESLYNYWSGKANFILLYDPLPEGSVGKGQTSKAGVPLIRPPALRNKIGIGLVPFGVIVDASGTVLGKGLVNEMSHVESLLELIATK